MAKSLRDLRIEKGQTLAQAAKALGTNISGVGSWERGDYGPHPRMVPKIAKHYGITPEEARQAVEASADEKKQREFAGAGKE